MAHMTDLTPARARYGDALLFEVQEAIREHADFHAPVMLTEEVVGLLVGKPEALGRLLRRARHFAGVAEDAREAVGRFAFVLPPNMPRLAVHVVENREAGVAVVICRDEQVRA